MKAKFFHGSSDYHEKYIPEGKCVTFSKPYASYYARRKHKGNGYIYVLLLDPKSDLIEEKIAETVDHMLVRKTRFSERIPLTEEVNKECDMEIAKIAASLRGQSDLA